MTANGKYAREKPEERQEGTSAAGARSEDADTAATQPEPEALPEPDPLDALRAENAELKDRLLRAMAEMENLRKRTEREKAEATLYAASNFARDILSVADSIGRALQAVPEKHREQADEATRNLIAGIEVTEKELLSVFSRHGIRRIDPLGEKFDPNLHQAMFEVPNPDVPSGTVVQVVQAGYLIGERLLRPALVGVSKDGTTEQHQKGNGADEGTQAGL